MSKSKHTPKRTKKELPQRPPSEYDFVFRHPEIEDVSVSEMMDAGIVGLGMLSALMADWAENSDAPKMHECVAHEISDRLFDLLYCRHKDETLRMALAAVTTVMDLIPNYGNYTFAAALEIGYENAYDLLANASDEDINKACVIVLDEVLKMFAAKVRAQKVGSEGDNVPDAE